MSPVTCAVAGVVLDAAGRMLLCRQRQGNRRWALPGGRARRAESPLRAAVREIHAETGVLVDLVDLVGLYHLDGGPADGRAVDAVPLPEVLVHVFRARALDPGTHVDAATCRVGWHDPDDLPEPMTPTTRVAVADAVAGRSGVLRQVQRDLGRPPEVRRPRDVGQPGDVGRPQPAG
jgi:8-oxo-dGTP pyrophosphatase MutT (NUDIX family)